MSLDRRRSFWAEACMWHGSVTPQVVPSVLSFGAIALIIVSASWMVEQQYEMRFALEVAPFEIAGAALGLLLILRTNAGYDRWWEARKLWGGIVNQSRNLAINGLTYGPDDELWRHRFVRWTASFPHVARCSLRGQSPAHEVGLLLGDEAASAVDRAEHKPSYVAMKIAALLRVACDRFQMDRFAYLQIDRERALLIDHIGACERILKSPLPQVYSIKIRRFIAMFLITVPFALLHQMSTDWLVPVITMLVAYPLIALDQIGIELQNPFNKMNLSHLPLGEISTAIEANLEGLLKTYEAEKANNELDWENEYANQPRVV